MAISKWLSSFSRLGTDLKSQIQPLRSQLLNDPYYRFRSVEEVLLAAQMGVYIDVNQAGTDDWLRLPGFSIHQARSLVALTQSGVQFHCLEDVAAVLNLPVQRLRSVEPILKFCYYDAESVCTIQPINVNTASAEMLTRVPAIDLFLARTIVEQRRLGRYLNLADLQQRLQLSPALTTTLIHYLRF